MFAFFMRLKQGRVINYDGEKSPFFRLNNIGCPISE
ncbi:hypothetical protein AAUPMC_09331, partial [Pasteurella multocida subsp. multocida str. Anand1_cattle]